MIDARRPGARGAAVDRALGDRGRKRARRRRPRTPRRRARSRSRRATRARASRRERARASRSDATTQPRARDAWRESRSPPRMSCGSAGTSTAPVPEIARYASPHSGRLSLQRMTRSPGANPARVEPAPSSVGCVEELGVAVRSQPPPRSTWQRHPLWEARGAAGDEIADVRTRAGPLRAPARARLSDPDAAAAIGSAPTPRAARPRASVLGGPSR